MTLAEPLGRGSDGDAEGPALDAALFRAALTLARADETEALKSALRQALDLLAGADTGSRYALCEVNTSTDGRPLIVWQIEGREFAVAEGGTFTAWYAAARRCEGEFEPVRGETGAGLLLPISDAPGWDAHLGLFVSDEVPRGDKAVLLRQFAELAAAGMARMARRRLDEINHRRLAEAGRDALAWLELGADVVWEAGTDGVIHCRRILNRRNDLAQSVEGADLSAVLVGAARRPLIELLREAGSVRHLRASLPAGDDGEIYYVSGIRREDAGVVSFVGALTAVQRGRGAADEAAAALLAARNARLREEQMRVEAEAMLEGLRLLLSGTTSREKLTRLTELLGESMRAGEAMIVEAMFDGRLRILAPVWEILDRSHARIATALGQDLDERHLRIYGVEEGLGEMLRHGLGLEGQSILALALPLRGETAYFVCAAREEFSPSALAFAERFALLLRQALFMREEQSQLAQTAKLAALGQMSASIAHELKQPLNTISLAAQNLETMLAGPKFDSALVEKKIVRMLAQVDRASDIIDRMRRFGRKSIGEHELVDLAELAEGVASMMRHVLERAGVEVTFDISSDVSAHADRLQIEQVLTNLIQNAVDAISGVGSREGAGASERRIHISVPRTDNRLVELRVEDSGPGFPAGIAERALEPFFTTKNAEQGTGLGLAICDAIVRESGGRLELGNHARGGFVSIFLPRG